MNWADIAAATSSSPFQAVSRHRPGLLRPEAPENDHEVMDQELDKLDEDCGDAMPMPMRFPDTHLGRLASIFSDRMPCTGMYGLPSMPQDGSFSMHEPTSRGSGSDESMDQTGLVDLDASGSSGGYALTPALGMPQFDEHTSAELQQLFPSSLSQASDMHAATSGPPEANCEPYPSTVQQASALPSAHGMGDPVDQFSEPYPTLQPPIDHAGSHMMMPFPFGAPPSAFEETDELTMQGATASPMEMQEVSSLFNNASLMTPPTAVTIPRTTIVSPLSNFGSQRMMLPPSLRDSKGDESLATAFDDDPNAKFSPDRRKLCCVEDCKSQARAFNRCKRHGGSKRCSNPGCTKSVQSRGLCIRHGGGSRCQENGCTRAAQSHGKCKMHGGGRPCVVPGCEKKAHLKRLCRKHGGGAKCSEPECEKWAQRQGMCMTHSKMQHSLLSSPSSSSSESRPLPSLVLSKRASRAFRLDDPASI